MSSCCETAKWKREEIADHKFDFVDVDDFVETSCLRQFSYSFVFLLALKAILVYFADLGVLALLLASNSLQTALDPNAQGSAGSYSLYGNLSPATTTVTPLTQFRQTISSQVSTILIAVSVLLSFILLIMEWRKAQIIIKSRDISYAFTSTISYRYYAIRSYAHYCFFSQIQNSRRTTDILAFFVFFRFKGWKRLLFAELPRVFFNALNLFAVVESRMNIMVDSGQVSKHENIIMRGITAYTSLMGDSQFDQTSKGVIILSTITVFIWAFSAVTLLIAFFIYIPLLFNIRGNLKEYCVHKIDKRIEELLRRKSRKRLYDAKKAERSQQQQLRFQQANGNHSPNSDSNNPTLPNVDVDLESHVSYPVYTAGFADYQYTPAPTHYAYQATGGSNPGIYSHAPSSVAAYEYYAPSDIGSNYTSAYVVQQQQYNRHHGHNQHYQYQRGVPQSDVGLTDNANPPQNRQNGNQRDLQNQRRK